MTTATQVRERLAASLRSRGLAVPGAGEPVDEPAEDTPCAVLAWAASGAMSLTGSADGPPRWPTGDVVGALHGTAALFADLAAGMNADAGPIDVGMLLTGRAAARGAARRGAVSVGGRSRILRAEEGWLAVTLSRPDDLEVLAALGVPAAAGRRTLAVEEAWDGLEAFTRLRPAGELMDAAQLLGLPAAEVATSPGDDAPWSITRLGGPVAGGTRRPTIVDLSAMWAGPLCAHLLGRCGGEVVKVEDAGRPDAARQGDPWLFEQLHAGHHQVVLDFSSASGRRQLDGLVAGADVVIEASRPRALGQLGLGPERFLTARRGRTWVSITARGRSGPRANWVGFGDDAAAGGGLVAAGDPRGPVFCADAVADPVSGLSAATAALASIAGGGGHLVDCSMVAASSFANRFGTCRGEHRTERRGDHWFVSHGASTRRVEPAGLPAVARQ